MPLTTRQQATKDMTGCSLEGVKVLVVGAGGIGCELVKNLVLSGFEDITMIDLDTIDYSNLNRQFLFRAHHVSRPKALVAREAVLEFPHDEHLCIRAEHGNIKETRFGPDFFKTFNIVLNALDNVDARRHVNRVCLATGIPLIESGTQGYLGQARAILKGRSKCFECDPTEPPKTYPVCTIRNHPDKDVHCIAWAKDLLFKKLFGGEETDLIDTSEECAQEAGADSAVAAPADTSETAPAPLQRAGGESAGAFAKRVFRDVFYENIALLLKIETLWKERRAPVQIDPDSLSLPDAAPLAEEDQRAWSVEENSAVFLSVVERILTQRAVEVGSLEFDKDDADALDFVTAAANLRSANFHIPLTSRWKVKEIAGRIIPAIATTNAIIAGFIVLEALKVLRGDLDACRYCVCNRLPSGKKRNVLLPSSKLDQPRPECFVCAGSTSALRVDTSTFTVRMLIEKVIKKHLSFNKPTVDLTNELDASVNPMQLSEGNVEALDNEERAEIDRWLDVPLAGLPVPLAPGAVFKVEDASQDLSLKIAVTHAAFDSEEHPSGFHFVAGETPQQGAAEPTADGAGDAEPPDAEGAEEGASVKRQKVGAPPSGSSAILAEGEDSCVVTLE